VEKTKAMKFKPSARKKEDERLDKISEWKWTGPMSGAKTNLLEKPRIPS
jgi:hypothetical protein